MKQSFKEKNAARKAAMEVALGGNKRSEVMDARRRRRIYKGKFGLSPNNIYNELTLGTSAMFNARKGKDPVL